MANNRPKPIEFDFEGTHYTLHFNRRAIQKMEQNGFDINNASVKIATSVLELFSGAFLAKHPFTKQADKERIFDLLSKKSNAKGKDGESETLYARLVALYSDTLTSILDSDDEGDENLISWS